MRTASIDLAEWERLWPGGAGVFHRPALLRVLDTHSPADLRIVAGYDGDDLVAVLPVFGRTLPMGRTLRSPPAIGGVPRLGPLVLDRSDRAGPRSSVNRTFVDGVVELAGADTPLTRCRVVCPLDYDDPRPFADRGFVVWPAFTYLLDVNGTDVDGSPDSPDSDGPPDSVDREGPSNTVDIRGAPGDAEDLTLSREGVDGVRAVHRAATRRGHVDERLVPWSFVGDLRRALGERLRAYVVRSPDGEYVAGITVLVGDRTAHCWLCGPPTVDGTDRIVTRLHRYAVRDLAADDTDVRRYDVGPARDDLDAALGASLVPYYTVESPRPRTVGDGRVASTRYH